jgi:branched-chain amino acid transport system substrate-binding protein
MNRRRLNGRLGIGVVAVAAAAALALAGCSSSSGSSGGGSTAPINIGLTTSMSGVFAATCVPQVNGEQAYIKSFNKAGGVNGRPINLDVVDDAADISKAVSNARTFIQNKDFAVFGECSTSAAAAIAPVLSSAQVPFVFSYAADQALYDPPEKYVFTVNPAYTQQATTLLSEAVSEAKKKGITNITVDEVEANVAGYQATINALKGEASKLGITYKNTILTQNGTADYGPTALKVKADNPTILFVQGGAPDGARLVKALSSAGAMPQYFLGVSAMASDAFITAGGNLTGSHLRLLSSVPAVQDMPKDSKCVAILKKAKVTVEPQALWGCGAAEILGATLKDAGKNLTTASFLKAIESQKNAKLSDVFPPITLSSKSHLALDSMYLVTLKDGQLTSSAKPQVLK